MKFEVKTFAKVIKKLKNDGFNIFFEKIEKAVSLHCYSFNFL